MKTFIAVLTATVLLLFAPPSSAGTPTDRGEDISFKCSPGYTEVPTVLDGCGADVSDVVIGGRKHLLHARAAIRRWRFINGLGLTFHYDTTCVVHPDWMCIDFVHDASILNQDAAGLTTLYGNNFCQISLAYDRSVEPDYVRTYFFGVVRHEVLHCLGMPHHEEIGGLMTYTEDSPSHRLDTAFSWPHFRMLPDEKSALRRAYDIASS